MTTGSRGLHVVAPIRRELDYPDVLAMAKSLATALVDEAPDALTTKFKKEQREGRVFVDYLRNRKAHTSVAPWAVRARAGAPVAMPLREDELSEDIGPRAWALRDVAERLKAGTRGTGSVRQRRRRGPRRSGSYPRDASLPPAAAGAAVGFVFAWRHVSTHVRLVEQHVYAHR